MSSAKAFRDVKEDPGRDILDVGDQPSPSDAPSSARDSPWIALSFDLTIDQRGFHQ
ncbi:hypothetical protein DXG01_015297 [Tephrocybe rancida]|nr:hypothetical protein DXG01_015297 [Tephrocybe rancida]